MFAVIVLYDLRYTHFGMPYDWREIRQAGRIRAAVLEGDTLFERQIREFATAKNLDCTIRYCDGDDELWLDLLMFRSDVIRPGEGNGRKYQWKVRENSTELRDTLDLWYDRNIRHISRYDHLFKQYGDSIGWDWKMLAAIGFVESRFRNVSCPGGLGVMQLSKVIARRFGAGGRVMDPRANIMAASEYIRYMDQKFSDIEDSTERQKFVIAAYNSGMKPVVTARSRARSARKDHCKWEEVKPYYRNNHSKRYQKKILKKYEEYKHKS